MEREEGGDGELFYGFLDMTLGGAALLSLFILLHQPFLEYSGVSSLAAGLLLLTILLRGRKGHRRKPVQR